MQAKLHC